jgi:peptidoglycan/xylan/chitin deacetylase (PgdA/CDA1 family)
MKPAIEIKNPTECGKVKYVLDNLLTPVGYPYRFVENWRKPAYRIKCGGTNEDGVDLWCPKFDRTQSSSIRLKKTYIRGVPVLYKKHKPSSLRNGNVLNFDIIDIPYQLITRQEETQWFQKNRVPQFPAYRSDLYEVGLLDEPVLDKYIGLLSEFIGSVIAKRYPNLDPLPKWKRDKEFAVVLSHDVDCIKPVSLQLAERYAYEAVANAEKRARERFEYMLLSLEQLYRLWVKPLSRPSANNIARWVELERKYDFRSTFYVAALSDRCRRDPTYYLEDRIEFKGRDISVGELFRLLRKFGWEIGLHGSLSTYNSKSRLQSEKTRLERSVRATVEGTRQHCLYFRTPVTWQEQLEAGFKYDSTLGYNSRLGHRAGISLPYRVPASGDENIRNFFEIPMTIHDNVLFYEEPTSKERVIERVVRRLDAVRDIGGVANLLWHPRCLRNTKWPTPIEVYEEILKYLDDQPAYVVTASDLRNYWVRRRKKIRL